MKILIVNGIKYVNCFESITWSGDYETPHRTLEVSYLKREMPMVKAGDIITFILDDKLVFGGRVFSTSTSGNKNDLASFLAYDSAIYLSKNKMMENFFKVKPSQAVKTICGKLGLTVGTLPVDHTKAIATFPAIGWDATRILKTFYTFQSKYAEQNYSILDYQGKICVIPMGILSNYILNSMTNIREATYSSSMEDMINKIIVYKSDDDENANTMKNVEYFDREVIERYGLIQDVIEYSGDDENFGYATTASYKDSLHLIDTEASITCNGSIELMSGYCVGVDIVGYDSTVDSINQCGIFYIKSDTHTWTHNDYTTSVELSFDKLVNNEEIDDIEKKMEASKVEVKTSNNGNGKIEVEVTDYKIGELYFKYLIEDNRIPTEEEHRKYLADFEKREKEKPSE